MKRLAGSELACFEVAGLLQKLKIPQAHTGCGLVKSVTLGRTSPAPAPSVTVTVPMLPLSMRQREVIGRACVRIADTMDMLQALCDTLAAEEIDPANADSGAGRMFRKGDPRPLGAAYGQLAALYAALTDIERQGGQPRKH